MTPLRYAGTLVPGVHVLRIIGLLVATLAGIATVTALASEDPRGAGLARFAYVNTSVFETSFGTIVPKRPLEPALSETAANKDADFRPVILLAAEAIASGSIEITESTQAVATDGISAVSLVGDVDGVPAVQDTPQQLASPDPSVLFAVSASPVQVSAPQLTSLESPARLYENELPVREPVQDIARQTAEQNTALKPSALTPRGVPVVEDAPQKIATVEPSAIIAGRAPDEILASRGEAPARPTPILKRPHHQRSTQATVHKRAHVVKKKVAAATVPKWATKMFEGPWQQHAFAYQ
jgi:hypothetical protein